MDKEINDANDKFFALKELYTREKKVEKVEIITKSMHIDNLHLYLGRSIILTDELIENYLPEGWGMRNKINLEFEMLGISSILPRECLFDMVEEIERQKKANFLKSEKCKTVMVTGPHGVGVSTLLSLLAIYARSNNWLTINISGNRVTSEHFIEPNRVLQDRFDSNIVAQELIRNILKSEESKLKTLPVRTPLPPHLVEEGLSLDESSSLFDLLTYGEENTDSSSGIFCHFRRELNLVTEFPVLLIVDDYNTFFLPTYFPDMFNPSYAVKRLPPEKLNLVRCLNEPNHTGLVNGMMVCGTNGTESRKHILQNYHHLLYEIPYLTYEETRDRVHLYQQRGTLIEGIPDISIQFIHQITRTFLELSKYLKIAC